MATNSVKKETVRPGTKRTFKDEFFVQQDNVALIEQYKDKIENMYEMQINMEEETEDGQWLVLHGDPVDRRNAKNYISAMCNPSERKQVQFPSASELTDPTTLEYIEKTTNAFIRPLKKIALFEISGTELAVTLALSQIEELAGTGIEGEEDYSDVDSNENDHVIEISPSTNKASSRLSDQLQRALSSHSDGHCSAADYRNACPSVQRVLVNCLQNEDEHEGSDEDSMFGDGKTDISQDTKSGAKTLNMYFVNADTENSGETDQKLPKSSPDNDARKMAELTICEESANPLLTKQQEYLKSFGLSVGFEESKVINAIRYVHEKTRPSDFLDILNSLPDENDDKDDDGGPGHVGEEDEGHHDDSDDDVIIESETIEYADNIKPIGETVEADKNIKGEMSALPDGYKERLIRDFMWEDDNSSVEDLKRRNAERQQLLRQNFIQQGQQSQENSESKTKKKKRKKKKGKGAENQQKKTGDDQTCVMTVWNPKNAELSQNTEEDQFQSPKRKNQKPVPPPLLQPQEKFRQNSPNRVQNQSGGGNQWNKKTKFNCQNEGPQRGNCKKPTQVVNPVNVPKATEGMYHQQNKQTDDSELRYIVIDGSNVAMIHGNGKHFSCKGIKICVDFFRLRGHDKITVFVPQWRRYRPSENNPILDQDILEELKDDGTLVFTPSRKIDHRLVASYDDRFVLELAEAEEAIIVSNDQYRDLMTEKAAWKKIIHERLLMFSFVRDRFMAPNDPLGRDGPCLDDFLKLKSQQNGQNPRLTQGYQYKQQQYYKPHSQGHNYVPYNQGQGYGYAHHQSNFPVLGQGHGQLPVNYAPTQNPGNYAGAAASGQINPGYQHQHAQQANFSAKNHIQKHFDYTDSGHDLSKSPRQPQKGQGNLKSKSQRIPRTEQESDYFFEELKKIFPEPDQEDTIRSVLANHIYEHDFAKLTNDCMNVMF